MAKQPIADILSKSKTDKNLDNLLSQINHAKAQADSDKAQNVARFNKSYLYYACALPGDTITGQTQYLGSSYVEPVLFNAVKAALPQLLDAFTTDDSLAVAFRSRGYRKNPAVEELVNFNLNKIFLRDQDGYATLENAIKTALITGDTFIKIYPDETVHEDSAQVDDWIELIEFMSQLAEEWTIKPVKGLGSNKSGSYKGFEWKEETVNQQDPQTGETVKQPILLVRGNVPLIKIDKKIIVEEVEPHDLWADTSFGDDFNKCRYIAHRVRTTVGDAKLRGFDEEKLKEATNSNFEDNKLDALYFSPTMYADPNSQSTSLTESVSVDENERKIDLYEHYIYSSIPNKKNETRLYQVVATDTEILKVTEIKRMPFVHGKAETIQGSFFGRSFYDVCKQYQDSLSLAARIANHQGALSAYNQWLTIKGQYVRQSLMDNRPGAIVEQMSQGAVERVPAPELSQSFLASVQMQRESMEETISQPVGFENADGGVPQVATATAYLTIFQESQKAASLTKSIERTLVRPMYELLYEIIRDEGFPLTAPDGSTVSGVELPSLYEMIVDPSTTHDMFAQNTQIMNAAAFVAQSAQVNSPVMTPANVYNIAKDMLDNFDIDSSKYLTDPAQNVDPLAAHEEAEAKAIQSEFAKVQLQQGIAELRKTTAEANKLEQEAEELIRNGHDTRLKSQADSAAKMLAIQSESQNKAAENQVKSFDAETKRKAVNYETILAAQKHATDITAPQVNGVR